MSWIIQQIRKEEWSPYAAGALLGGVVGLWLFWTFARLLRAGDQTFRSAPPRSE